MNIRIARTLLLILAVLAAPQAWVQGFTLEDDGTQVLILELGKPVFGYRYGAQNPEEGPQELHFIDPFRGLWGEEVTGKSRLLDGHSGIFWAWRNCRAGGRLMDVWDGVTSQRLFERWITRSASVDQANLGLQNVWVFEDTGEAQVMETVFIRVWPTQQSSRIVDVSILLRNISTREVTLGGSGLVEGFCVRMNPGLKGITLSGGQGVVVKGDTAFMSPWLDISYHDARRSSYSGLSIFQHPQNPGFSGPNWHLGEDGLYGAGLLPSEQRKLRPGESLRFRYRLYSHRGFGPNLVLEEAYATFLRESERTDQE